MSNDVLTPEDILESILKDPGRHTRKYIILGRPGPTGKTWLWYKLLSHHLTAIEISEGIYDLVDYRDTRNHHIKNVIGNTEIIVLNRYLINL